MEIEQRDLDKLRHLLEQMYDTADWKVGTDPLADFVHPKLNQAIKILDSYLEPDSMTTTSELFEQGRFAFIEEEGAKDDWDN